MPGRLDSYERAGIGVGQLLIWSVFALPRAHRERQPGRLDDLLVRASLGGVPVTGFVGARSRLVPPVALVGVATWFLG